MNAEVPYYAKAICAILFFVRNGIAGDTENTTHTQASLAIKTLFV